MPKKSQRPEAWGTSYDEYGDPSGEFCANRKGYLILRSKIDEVLEKGVVKIGPESEYDFEVMKLDEVHPFDTLSSKKIVDGLFRFTVISIGVIAAGLMAYGAHQFWFNFIK